MLSPSPVCPTRVVFLAPTHPSKPYSAFPLYEVYFELAFNTLNNYSFNIHMLFAYLCDFTINNWICYNYLLR